MRVALISVASGISAAIAGRSVAQRQLDFALALGCERIICHGNGALPEAIALRHDSENAGAKFQVVRDAHGLLGATGTADAIFVFAEGLLPESHAALDLLDQGSCIIVMSAALGVDAGFERLDLEHAWAGAMRLPGRLVEHLAELPGDADPIPALLRIARQAGLVEKALAAGVLAGDDWRMLLSARDGEDFEQTWLERRLPAAPRFAPSKKGMRWIGGRFARRLASVRPGYALGAATLLVVSAVILAWFAYPALGFGLTALASLSGELGAILGKVRLAGFRRSRTGPDWTNLARLTIDCGLVAVSFLSLQGTWFERLFAPLVLVGLLLIRPSDLARSFGAFVGDRTVVATALAVAAAFGSTEPAIMLFALALLATYFIVRPEGRG